MNYFNYNRHMAIKQNITPSANRARMGAQRNNADVSTCYKTTVVPAYSHNNAAKGYGIRKTHVYIRPKPHIFRGEHKNSTRKFGFLVVF